MPIHYHAKLSECLQIKKKTLIHFILFLTIKQIPMSKSVLN